MSSNYAVIADGGHQYRVSEGDILDFQRHDLADDSEIRFDEVLLCRTDEGVSIGRPTVDGAYVLGRIQGQFRDKKIVVQKFKRRKGYRRKQGHRQNLTRIQITKVVTD